MSWLDTFDSYGVGSTSLLATYPNSLPNANARLSAYGRNGTEALVLNNESTTGTARYYARGLETPTGGRTPYVRMGFAIYLNGGSRFTGDDSLGQRIVTLRVAGQRRPSPNVTYFEIAGVVQSLNNDNTWSAVAAPDYQQVTGVIEGCVYRRDAVMLGVSSDGFLRVSKSNTDGIFGSQEPVISRSTKQLQFDQWSHIELSLYLGAPDSNNGYVYVWLDGELVGSATDVLFSPEANYNISLYSPQSCFPDVSLLSGPREASGGQYYNADNQGLYDFCIHRSGALATGMGSDSPTFFNRLDDLYVITGPIATAPNVPLGDLVARPLAVVADGASQDSTIGGTSPAATRWQSVATDDGDVTRVEMVPDDADQYVPDTLTGSPTVAAVRVRATVKKSDGGAGGVAVGLTNTDGAVESNTLDVDSASAYEVVDATFVTDALGASWTPATVNDAELTLRRVL